MSPIHILWALLALIVLTMGAVTTWPTMYVWSLNILRFIAPVTGWGLWGLMALSLLPWIASAVTRALERLGEGLREGWMTLLGCSIGVAAVVFGLPDRGWFLGDFMLRQGAMFLGDLESAYQQALPLDWLLHGYVPRFLLSTLELHPAAYARGLGAIEAGILAVIAGRIARRFELSSAATAASFLVIAFGGYLVVFTGLSKSSSELCVLTAAVALAGLRVLREGRGYAALGLVGASALLLHRSALLLAPALLHACIRQPEAGKVGWRRWLPALAPVGLALLLIAPRLASLLSGFDWPRHLRPGSEGVLAATLAPLHLLDLANLVVVFSPLAVPAGLLALVRHPLPGPAGERRHLVLLAVPWLAVMLFVHPQQGVIRDWDVFAPGGVAISILAAAIIGRSLDLETSGRWLAGTVAIMTVGSAVLWMTHFHSPEMTLRRARAIARESPMRDEATDAVLWDYITVRSIRLGDWPAAIEGASEQVRHSPDSRSYFQLGIANTRAGRDGDALQAYANLLARDSTFAVAWLGYTGAAWRSGDSSAFRRGRAKLATMGLDDRARIERHVIVFPEAWPPEAGDWSRPVGER